MSVDSVESEKNYLLCSFLKFILLILKNNIHFYKYSITFNEKQSSYLLLTQNNYEIFSYNSIDVKHYWELDTIRKWFIKICSYYVPMYCLHTKEYIQPISHKIKRPLINFAYNIHVCIPHGKKSLMLISVDHEKQIICRQCIRWLLKHVKILLIGLSNK